MFDVKVKDEKKNHTGIPTQLKKHMEESTGLSFDDVRVHYNSGLPAKLGALAYTQGNQVEIGPGQERHLSHELGHVVQQKLGAVRANTKHISGVAMNTDEKLERQADEIAAGKKVDIVQRAGANVVQMERDISHVSQSRRNDVQTFFYNLKKDFNGNWLNLYSEILPDGDGDAGQLKILYEKINSVAEALNVKDKVRMLCVFSLTNEERGAAWNGERPAADNEAVEQRRAKIQSILGMSNQTIKHVSEFTMTKGLREGAFQPLGNDWEVEYPVPDRSFTADEGHLLKIKEMGEESKIIDTIKAGDTTQDGIGYGIPDELVGMEPDNPNSAESFLIQELGNKYHSQLFQNAWIVSIKNYIYIPLRKPDCDSNPDYIRAYGDDQFFQKQPYPVEKMIDIVKEAKENGAKLIIFAGMDAQNFWKKLSIFERYNFRDISIIFKNIPNDTLKDLMAKVKNGVIISGGEGLFAESLAAPESNNTASVLAGRYAFQYYELATALANMDNLEEIKPSDSNAEDKLKEFGLKYRFFKFGLSNPYALYFYYTGNAFIEILKDRKITEQYFLNGLLHPDSKYNLSEEERTLSCSMPLSALYLPLHFNGSEPIEMPKIFRNDMQNILQIFRRLKSDLVPVGWLRLIDRAVSQADNSVSGT